MLRSALLRCIFKRNSSINVIKCPVVFSNAHRSAISPSELHQGPLRFFSESAILTPSRWTDSNKTRSNVSDRVQEEDTSDVFGDYSRKFSSRRTFRKTSPEQQQQLDLKYRDVDEEGEQLVEKFKSKTGRKNTTYWYFLQCKRLIKEDKLAEALVLFEADMLKGERLPPEEYNYTVLIGGCGRVGYLKKAFQLYNNMKKRGIEPSDATYTALFNACAESPWKQSGLENALKLKQELLKKNVPLSAITQHALLKTVALAGDLKSCFQILREMLQNGQAISQETFHYLLMSCVKDKQHGFRLALQVWHQMLRIGIKPDTQNYNILLRVARDCGIGDPGLASALLLKRTEEVTPKLTSGRKNRRTKVKEETSCQPLDMDAFENELFVDARTQNHEQAKETDFTLPKEEDQCRMDTSQNESQMLPVSTSGSLTCHSQSSHLPNLLDPSTCHTGVVALGPVNSASDRLALIGNLEGFLEKMAKDGVEPNIKTITLLADVMEADSQSLQSLINVAKKSGVNLDETFFNVMIRRVAKAGNLDGAKAVKALMVNRGLVANAQTFCSIALACRRQKDAMQLLTEMESCGLVPNAHVYSALISQAVKRLDYAYLHKLLQHMHKLQVAPNEVIIRQLEFAAQYPTSYDKLKSRNTYLDKIDGFRGFYKEWTEHNIPIIILSDDDDDDDEGELLRGHNDSSVLIVENDRNEADVSKHIEELDEDLAITFSQTATVLPHARYDCTLAFCRAEQDISGPLQDNAKHCDQCFCYICDKLASMCELWTIPGICHCNAHKHSVYWKALRDKSLMGFLHELNFTFDPLDMDSDLRFAETSLQKFAGSLAMKYATFLLGFENPNNSTNCRCTCHRNITSTTQSQTIGCKGCYKHHFKMLEYDYTVVSQHIKMYLNEAKKENPKACVVMLLGAIKLFVNHTTPGNMHAANTVAETVSTLLWRFMTKVWTLLVGFDFSDSFIKQLESFYQRLSLPSNCSLPKSLSVLPWDDPLLSAVMKGQNITGERQVKGRRHQVLCEPLVVIQARVCKLQQQNKYRELARYLKVVKSINNPTLQRMKDLVPLYLCKDGDYSGAVCHMLSPLPGATCLASRLTPQQFRAYLRILTSAHAPDVAQELDTPNGHMIIPDPLLSTKWTPIEGSNSFKMMEVLKFALRVLDCNGIVFADSETWLYLLSVVSSSYTTPDGVPVGAFLAEPDVTYQTVTREAASAILEELTTTSRIQIPKTFESGYPDQARLLLATQALVLRIFHSQFRPILSVIISFRFNRWALRWWFYSLLVRPDVLHYLLCCLVEELSDERYQLLQRKWGESEHSMVAYFLCMCFWENGVVLDLNTYPTNSLLAIWNERRNPWQRSLKLYLECNVAKLTPEKRQILHQIQQQGK
ncbi:hypothetical protein Q8A67_004398 [Cirrhinus molitorella]|uniref:Uncharacterized protein n=1 Tax=Cirrhinus molitorella TaxID=172907 RepID=A0AA88Q831_9TELE|nr:hypothetical protein Q8A67_004398 [Cirrhinus molitorella]